MKTGIILAVLISSLGYSVFGETQVVTNGGFEQGSAGWQVAGGGTLPLSGTNFARSGSACLTLGGPGNTNQVVYQTITLPADTLAATLSYYYSIQTFDPQTVDHAHFWADITDATGNLLTNVAFQSNIGQPQVPVYQQKSFDLTAYGGRTIQVQFQASTSFSMGTYFNVDDVSVVVVRSSDQASNDAFAGRTVLSGTNISVTATNAYATKEPGEPDHAGRPGGASLWWTWTAPDYGNVTITTDGSTFDTLLAVYTGTTVSNLTRVVSNDNESDTRKLTSKVTFNASPGTQYQIAVDGLYGVRGIIQLGLRFQLNPFIPFYGSYPGLFSVSNEMTFTNAGAVTISLSGKGSFSSKVQLAGSSYSLSGKFGTNGLFSGSIKRKGLNPLSVQLQLDMAGGDVVTGQISDGTWTADVEANRGVYSSKSNPAPLGGKKYTLIIPCNEDGSSQPGGYGFGSVKIDAAGKVSFSGTLGDGTKVSQKTSVSKDGQWPFYLSLYSRKGSMQGWLSFTNETNSAPSGLVHWTRLANAKSKVYPAGFSTNGLPVVGSVYTYTKGTPVLNMPGGGVVVLEQGNLSQSITNACTLGTNNKVTGTNKLNLTITTSTGLFKGKVFNPATGKPVTASGAVLQNQNAGFGYFPGTNQSGSVYLGE